MQVAAKGLPLGLTQGSDRWCAAVWNNGIHPNGDFKAHRQSHGNRLCHGNRDTL